MAVRKFKPTTPGQRHKIIGTFTRRLLRGYQKNLLFMARSLQVVVTAKVR